VYTIASVTRYDKFANLSHSLIYGTFCGISFLWVVWIVPETRGVTLGKAMDSLFRSDDDSLSNDDSEVTETTGLLQGEQRRTSIVVYT